MSFSIRRNLLLELELEKKKRGGEGEKKKKRELELEWLVVFVSNVTAGKLVVFKHGHQENTQFQHIGNHMQFTILTN